MRRFIFFVLLILFANNILFAQPDGVSIKLEYTGHTIGSVLKLTITNNSDKLYYERVNPFLLNPGKNSQALLIPFGQILNVKAGEKKDIYLNGYSVFPDRTGKTNVNNSLSLDIILEAINHKLETFAAFFADTTRYKKRDVRISELMPFDYILTVPGTFGMLGFTFDPEKNKDLATTLLVEQAQRIARGYDRLFTAGRIVSHFNADPVFEKELFMQLSIWICGSGIEGNALKNIHIKKIITELYAEFSQDDKSREIAEHIDTYYKILERIGKESNVFLVPLDFDKRPQCLPAIVGLVPTSDNVKAPTFTKTRYDVLSVRNQVMHKRNDCLPCSIAGDLYATLKNYIYAFEVNRLLEEFNDLYEVMNEKFDSSSDAQTALNLSVAKLETLKNYDAVSWLQNNTISKDERINIAINEYDQISKDLIRTGMGARLLKTVGVFSIVSIKHKYLLQYILDNYNFRDTKYSFDCCDITRKPNLSEIQLAGELADFAILGINRASNAFNKISDELDNAISSKEELINEFIKAGSELYSLQALLKTFRILTHDNQIVCMDGPPPSSRIEALGRINTLLGTNIQQNGEFLQDKLYLRNSENEELEFHFGDCKCGKQQESHMPLLPIRENSMESLNNIKQLPLKLTPHYELSAFYGRLYFANSGADKFNGGGLAPFDSINPILDSILKSTYSKFYKLNEPKDFHFNYFNHIEFNAAIDIHKNFQYRIGASFFSGSVEGILPLSYYEKPSDSTTLVIVDASIYSKIKAWSAESGFRYYYGKHSKVYAGLAAQYMSFKNTQSRTYIENLEIQNPVVVKQYAVSAYFEAGIRYYPNQDFFVELGGQLYNRWDKDVSNVPVSGIDKSFRLGVGARF